MNIQVIYGNLRSSRLLRGYFSIYCILDVQTRTTPIIGSIHCKIPCNEKCSPVINSVTRCNIALI